MPINTEGLVDEGPQPTSIRMLSLHDNTMISSLPISETALEIRDLSFSPDSTLIASGLQGSVTIWRVNDGQVVQTIDRYGWLVTFMSNNELLIVDERWQIGDTGPLETIDFATHLELRGYGFREAISPDGIHRAVAAIFDAENPAQSAA